MEDTKKWLKLVIFGLLILGASELLWGGVALADSVIIMVNDEITTAGGFFCLSGLLELVAIILVAVGIFKSYENSDSISSAHKTKVTLAGILFALMVMIGIGVSITQSGYQGTEIDYESMAFTGGVVGTISSLLFVGFIILLVYEIAKKEHRNFLSVIAIVYIVVNFAIMFWLVTFEGGLNEFSQREGIYSITEGVFSIVFSGMFYLVRENLSIPMMDQKPRPGYSPPVQPPPFETKPNDGFSSGGQPQHPPPERESTYEERPPPPPDTTPNTQNEEVRPKSPPPPPPEPKKPNKFCPSCGDELRFIKEYEEWYCDRCREYKDI